MMAAEKRPSLLDRLPEVRGSYEAAAPLSKLTWFRTGGPAEVLYRPVDEEDLIDFLDGVPADVPLTVIGVGSNVLVRDGGVSGVVIRLGKPFANIEIDGERISAGAGAMDVTVSARALEAGLGGLEFLKGVPGTVGGALRMNAGAYEREVADVLVAARAVDRDGTIHVLRPEDMGFSYRKSRIPEDWIFLSATFRGRREDRAKIEGRVKEIVDAREESQPLRTRTGGSTFKNPDPKISGGRKAWELIDAAGCRGLGRGGAVVSEKHCNFLINTGTATSSDLEMLGEDVRRRVFEKTGVRLEWEIRRIGDKGEGWL